MTAHMLLKVSLAVSFASHCQADTFLAATPRVSTAHIRQSLWAELGSRANPVRLAQLEKELRPMYSALPKAEHGNLETAVVRYAAHRYFVHRHGWHLKGLEPSTNAKNLSDAASIRSDMVPSYVQNIFEEYLGKQGFSLHDLAIFMATLEDLVNQDRLSELLKSYELHALPTEESLLPHLVDTALHTYMSSYILGMNLSSMTRQEYEQHNMDEQYPGWADTVTWVQDVRQTVDFNGRDRANPFVRQTIDLAGAELVVDEIGDRYGSFQDLECRSLKDMLVSMENGDSGRVRLSDFYRKGLDGDWQFTESVAYLRELGALDESDPKRPSVIIPNYVGGQSNCLVSTGFYTVCCMDECEGLLYHVESKLGAPLAQPEEIISVVSALSSDTIQGPRNLSEDLLHRLQEIAEHHEGQVPLHGRLFAQWMHHAFSRECPFPHESGTTSPMTQEAWAETYGEEALLASNDEKHEHIRVSSDHAAQDIGDSLPWTKMEELVGSHRHHRPTGKSSTSTVAWRSLLFLAPVAFGFHLVRQSLSAKTSSSTTSGSFKDKSHFV